MQNRSDLKVLVVSQVKETLAKFDLLTREHAGQFSFKTTHFESFQEGKKSDKFDCVIFWVPEDDFDTLEMSEDFYKHYSIAPVTAWYTSADAERLNETFKTGDGDVHAKSEDNKASLKTILDQCRQRYNKVLDEDVTPAFNKFDKDGSGAIDKQELGELSKDLG